MKNVLEFTVKNTDGKEISLKALKPTHKQRLEAEKVRNTTFRDAIKSGAFLMEELSNELKKRGYWNDEKEAEVKELQDFVNEGLKRLNEGGFDVDEAKRLALEITSKRFDLMSLTTVRSSFVDKTAEGQANNASFDFLVSQCVVYNTSDSLGGKPYFGSFDDYLNRKGDDDGVECASKLFELIYNRNTDDSINNLPENQFLREFGFVDDKGRLINEDGKFVDNLGRLVDEEGYLINDEGKRVDEQGNLLDEKGNLIVDKSKRKPFTKNGAPIGVKTEPVKVGEVEAQVEVQSETQENST